jgi:hypothetical protein
MGLHIMFNTCIHCVCSNQVKHTYLLKLLSILSGENFQTAFFQVFANEPCIIISSDHTVQW